MKERERGAVVQASGTSSERQEFGILVVVVVVVLILIIEFK
jgi:hypothetical protein